LAKRRLPIIFYNPVTLLGTAIALLSFGLILFLILLEVLAEESKPYMGIIAFVILPAFLIMGLILIAIGVLRARKQRKDPNEPVKRFPRIDLNDPKQQRAFLIFSFGTVLLLLFSAFGSYKAYEYTDSDEFCGTICHEVMEPEYTAYLSSPHSRVGCVSCHIGSGADWFVRAKISGAYQVYSVLFNKYSRPIPTPIHDLRPAQGTCEQCHWPKHFFSEKKVDYTYYLSDEDNTKSTLSMLLKIGGGNSEAGITSGIHWHMNIANEITYVSDSSRTVIPWVKSKSDNGEEIIYTHSEIPFSDEDLSRSEVRKMDCIDCHNRPSHIFNQPDKMVNLFMSNGQIDESLPYIKSVAVQALEKKYYIKNNTYELIRDYIENFYSTNYPEIASAKRISIAKSIETVQRIYERNYFPEMNVSWRRFPDNIGHTYSVGCFRCHDGKHFSSDGRMISDDCNICHSIISQGPRFDEKNPFNQDFIHPAKLQGRIENQLCTDCHAADRNR
jgi:nitrate/TMAO reductase-like tetraheme cytochrome c subunit